MTKYDKTLRSLRMIAKEIILEEIKEKPLRLETLYKLIRKKKGEMCDDNIKCSCGRETLQPEWKHQIRWALYDLKYKKEISLDKESGLYKKI